METPHIHYHVMLIIPFDESEADKPNNIQKLMFIPEDKMFFGVFAYEKAYAATTPTRTLVGCYRNCEVK